MSKKKCVKSSGLKNYMSRQSQMHIFFSNSDFLLTCKIWCAWVNWIIIYNHLAITENDKLQNRLYEKKVVTALHNKNKKSICFCELFFFVCAFSGNFIFDLFYSNEIVNSFIGWNILFLRGRFNFFILLLFNWDFLIYKL